MVRPMIAIREATHRPPGSGRYSVYRHGPDRIPGEPQHVEVDLEVARDLLAREGSVWSGSPALDPRRS